MNRSRHFSTSLSSRGVVLLGVLGLGLAISSCAATRAGEADREAVREAIRKEQYREGVTLAADLCRIAPTDEELQQLHRLATLAYYLNLGRKATLAEEDDEALEWFAQAAQVDPDSKLVREWQQKTLNKLASKWTAIGNEAFASENYRGASEAYTRVLGYVPNHPTAMSGLGHVTIMINHRNGLGEEYYKEGIRALSDYRLRSARRGFTATTKYLPEQSRAVRRATEVDQLLAEQRVQVALGFEAEGLYAGALNEFRFAHLLDEENQAAIDGLSRLELEAEAAEFLRDAQMKIYRHELDDALALLDEGVQKTTLQKAEYALAREGVLDQKLEDLYQQALVLEHDGDYVQAIAGYGELLKQVDYYKDARARISTLEGYVAAAAGYYADAVAAQDAQGRLQHLEAIFLFWPDYKPGDKTVRQLIEDVKRHIDSEQ